MNTKFIQTLKWIIYPPFGEGARELIALLFIAVGLPRITGWAGPAPVTYMPSQVYGILLCLCSLLLLFTLKIRYGIMGRMVAVFGVFLTAALTIDVWPSVAAALLYGVLCYSLFGQAGATYAHK